MVAPHPGPFGPRLRFGPVSPASAVSSAGEPLDSCGLPPWFPKLKTSVSECSGLFAQGGGGLNHLLVARVQAGSEPASGVPALAAVLLPTGAGKTYTMLGTDAEPGIYLQTLTDLFRAIEDSRDNADCSVSMSYLEVSLPAGLGETSALGASEPSRETYTCAAFAPRLLPVPLVSLLPDL